MTKYRQGMQYETHYYCPMHKFIPKEDCIEYENSPGFKCPHCGRRVRTVSKHKHNKPAPPATEVREVPLTDMEVMELVMGQ